MLLLGPQQYFYFFFGDVKASKRHNITKMDNYHYIILGFSMITQLLNRKYFCNRMRNLEVRTLIINLDKTILRPLSRKPTKIVFCITSPLGNWGRAFESNSIIRRTVNFLLGPCGIDPNSITFFTFTPFCGNSKLHSKIRHLCRKHDMHFITIERHCSYIRKNRVCNEARFLGFLEKFYLSGN